MYRIGWLFIGLGVLFLLTHGGFGFFFFPLLFLPLLWILLFGGWRRPYRYGWGGAGHGWYGDRHGRCTDDGPRDQRDEPQPAAKPAQREYTGETTRL
ncbi:MAG TPA: hypothetical protein VKE41_23835 [Roseiflexaceae bacterium]|nr:hypothetical protein [Roseiflexaceae bacterium]